MTAAGLEKIDDALHPGPETREALRLLTDSSAFLDPPPAEIPARAAPSIAEQQTMMNGGGAFCGGDTEAASGFHGHTYDV
jgi:hypothetical protein